MSRVDPLDPLDPLDPFALELEGTRMIEASAGTGKTWNICVLYLRLLLDPAFAHDVRSIVVITFTTKATAELRERIRNRLLAMARWLEEGQPADDDFHVALFAAVNSAAVDSRRPGAATDIANRLAEALANFDDASIFTIHTFCQRALSDNAFVAGAALKTELIEGPDRNLVDEAETHWRSSLQSLPLPFLDWLLSNKESPQSWARLLKDRMARPLSHLVWPAAADDQAVQAAQKAQKARSDALIALRHEWEHGAGAATELLVQASKKGSLTQTSFKECQIKKSTDAWEACLEGAEPKVGAFHDAAGKVNRDFARFSARLIADGMVKKARDKGEAPPAHPVFDAVDLLLDADAALDAAYDALRVRILRELLEQGPARIRDRRRIQRQVGFDDMLFNLWSRLQGEAGEVFAAHLRERFPAIVVDEFQDTDAVQWKVLQAIAPRTLLLVGDPKQAIYSFRGADLHTYLQARAQAQQCLSLAKNQRSDRELIDALNHVFGCNDRVFIAEGISYQQVGFGEKPRARFEGDPGAALQLWMLEPPQSPAKLNAADALTLVAVRTAREIRRLLDLGAAGRLRIDGRPLAAADVAVIVRSHPHAARIVAALRDEGIRSVTRSRMSVFASAEARELAQVLAAIADPSDLRLLGGAMLTGLFGMDARGLDDAMRDEGRLLARLARLRDWHALWKRSGPARMIRDVLAAFQVESRWLPLPDGHRRLTNLRHLIELLQKNAGAMPSTLSQLQWLRGQIDAANDPDNAEENAADELALRLEDDRELVQVVTIHASKGLEYPIVFCPTLWNGKVGQRAGRYLLHHDAVEGACMDFDLAPGPSLDIRRERALVDAWAEFMRLVYVAMTRAVHRLYVAIGSGGGNGFKTSPGLVNWLPVPATTATAMLQSPMADNWDNFVKKTKTARGVELSWKDLVAPAREDADDAAGDSTSANDVVVPESIQIVDLASSPVSSPLLAPARVPLSAAALPSAIEKPRFEALPAPQRIAAAEWTASFSRLIRDLPQVSSVDPMLQQNRATADDANVDDAIVDTGDVVAQVAIDDDDILHFPRGPAAGDCMHAVFERVDFASDEHWSSAIGHALDRFAAPGVIGQDEQSRGARERMLQSMLRHVLDANLAPFTGSPKPAKLASIPSARRVHEFEFLLPCEGLVDRALVRAIRDAGIAVPELGFGELRGFLAGFIDLVFELDGRYYVLDWKSNHLGWTQHDYERESMQHAMSTHHYHLQRLLYLVALHRFLRVRLKDYSPATHLGGSFYLFLRGIRPAWRDSRQRSCGVFFEAAELDLIDTLDQMLSRTQP